MRRIILLSLLPLALTGCAQLGRPLSDAMFGAGGGILGHKLSNGDPIATAGGVTGGVLLSEGIHAWKTKSEQKAYAQGFQKGRSDGVKQIYWNLQAQHRNPLGPHHHFEVVVPEHRDGGVLFKETKQTIPE